MSNRLDELFEKYWKGETDLQEEKELKTLLGQSEGYPDEKAFFNGLEELGKEEPEDVSIPERKAGIFRQWLKMAAVLAMLLGSFAVFHYQKQERKQQELAYVQVMEAFGLIQDNMQVGREELRAMEDFRYLNMTNEIFNAQMGSE